MEYTESQEYHNVDIKTLLKASSNISLTSSFVIDKILSDKSKTSGHGTTVLKCQIIWISEQ